ncbi:hypothetical protein BY996DRAFT_4586385, partial [Phakopsora pachyrhizi]
LKPSMSNRNFMISPLGSQPMEWEQVVKYVPNQKTLAEDLSLWLCFLGDYQEEDQ